MDGVGWSKMTATSGRYSHGILSPLLCQSYCLLRYVYGIRSLPAQTIVQGSLQPLCGASCGVKRDKKDSPLDRKSRSTDRSGIVSLLLMHYPN